MKKITIIGGGFSGLTLALELVTRGFAVEVLEKKSWGGLIQTKIFPEMQAETAANAFLMTAALEKLAATIGCELVPTQKIAKNRFIFRGRPRRWPISLLSTVFLLFWVLPLAFWNRSKLAPLPMETVETWGRRVFNNEILQYLISPALQGIYAGDVRKLSATLLLGFIFAKKSHREPRPKQRGSMAPSLGMGQFMEKLRAEILRRGVVLKAQEVLNLDEIPRPLVLATSPLSVAQLLDPEWKEVEMLSLVKVTVAFQEPCQRIQGFGILFPEAEKFHALGVLANSQIFPNRGQLYNEAWILGGARSPEHVNLNDAEILKLIREDRLRALGSDDAIMKADISRWPQGLTHYTVAHEEFLKVHLQSSSPTPLQVRSGVFVTGNFLGRLGLGKILQQNQELAQTIEELHG